MLFINLTFFFFLTLPRLIWFSLYYLLYCFIPSHPHCGIYMLHYFLFTTLPKTNAFFPVIAAIGLPTLNSPVLYFLNTSKHLPYTQSTMRFMLDPSNSAFIFILFIPHFCPSSLSLFSSTFYFMDLRIRYLIKFSFHIAFMCSLLLEWSLSYHFTFPRLHSTKNCYNF